MANKRYDIDNPAGDDPRKHPKSIKANQGSIFGDPKPMPSMPIIDSPEYKAKKLEAATKRFENYMAEVEVLLAERKMLKERLENSDLSVTEKLQIGITIDGIDRRTLKPSKEEQLAKDIATREEIRKFGYKLEDSNNADVLAYNRRKALDRFILPLKGRPHISNKKYRLITPSIIEDRIKNTTTRFNTLSTVRDLYNGISEMNKYLEATDNNSSNLLKGPVFALDSDQIYYNRLVNINDDYNSLREKKLILSRKNIPGSNIKSNQKGMLYPSNIPQTMRPGETLSHHSPLDELEIATYNRNSKIRIINTIASNASIKGSKVYPTIDLIENKYADEIRDVGRKMFSQGYDESLAYTIAVRDIDETMIDPKTGKKVNINPIKKGIGDYLYTKYFTKPGMSTRMSEEEIISGIRREELRINKIESNTMSAIDIVSDLRGNKKSLNSFNFSDYTTTRTQDTTDYGLSFEVLESKKDWENNNIIDRYIKIKNAEAALPVWIKYKEEAKLDTTLTKKLMKIRMAVAQDNIDKANSVIRNYTTDTPIALRVAGNPINSTSDLGETDIKKFISIMQSDTGIDFAAEYSSIDPNDLYSYLAGQKTKKNIEGGLVGTLWQYKGRIGTEKTDIIGINTFLAEERGKIQEFIDFSDMTGDEKALKDIDRGYQLDNLGNMIGEAEDQMTRFNNEIEDAIGITGPSESPAVGRASYLDMMTSKRTSVKDQIDSIRAELKKIPDKSKNAHARVGLQDRLSALEQQLTSATATLRGKGIDIKTVNDIVSYSEAPIKEKAFNFKSILKQAKQINMPVDIIGRGRVNVVSVDTKENKAIITQKTVRADDVKVPIKSLLSNIIENQQPAKFKQTADGTVINKIAYKISRNQPISDIGSLVDGKLVGRYKAGGIQDIITAVRTKLYNTIQAQGEGASRLAGAGIPDLVLNVLKAHAGWALTDPEKAIPIANEALNAILPALSNMDFGIEGTNGIEKAITTAFQSKFTDEFYKGFFDRDNNVKGIVPRDNDIDRIIDSYYNKDIFAKHGLPLEEYVKSAIDYQTSPELSNMKQAGKVGKRIYLDNWKGASIERIKDYINTRQGMAQYDDQRAINSVEVMRELEDQTVEEMDRVLGVGDSAEYSEFIKRYDRSIDSAISDGTTRQLNKKDLTERLYLKQLQAGALKKSINDIKLDGLTKTQRQNLLNRVRESSKYGIEDVRRAIRSSIDDDTAKRIISVVENSYRNNQKDLKLKISTMRMMPKLAKQFGIVGLDSIDLANAEKSGDLSWARQVAGKSKDKITQEMISMANLSGMGIFSKDDINAIIDNPKEYLGYDEISFKSAATLNAMIKPTGNQIDATVNGRTAKVHINDGRLEARYKDSPEIDVIADKDITTPIDTTSFDKNYIKPVLKDMTNVKGGAEYLEGIHASSANKAWFGGGVMANTPHDVTGTLQGLRKIIDGSEYTIYDLETTGTVGDISDDLFGLTEVAVERRKLVRQSDGKYASQIVDNPGAIYVKQSEAVKQRVSDIAKAISNGDTELLEAIQKDPSSEWLLRNLAKYSPAINNQADRDSRVFRSKIVDKEYKIETIEDLKRVTSAAQEGIEFLDKEGISQSSAVEKLTKIQGDSILASQTNADQIFTKQAIINEAANNKNIKKLETRKADLEKANEILNAYKNKLSVIESNIDESLLNISGGYSPVINKLNARKEVLDNEILELTKDKEWVDTRTRQIIANGGKASTYNGLKSKSDEQAEELKRLQRESDTLASTINERRILEEAEDARHKKAIKGMRSNRTKTINKINKQTIEAEAIQSDIDKLSKQVDSNNKMVSKKIGKSKNQFVDLYQTTKLVEPGQEAGMDAVSKRRNYGTEGAHGGKVDLGREDRALVDNVNMMMSGKDPNSQYHQLYKTITEPSEVGVGDYVAKVKGSIESPGQRQGAYKIAGINRLNTGEVKVQYRAYGQREPQTATYASELEFRQNIAEKYKKLSGPKEFRQYAKAYVQDRSRNMVSDSILKGFASYNRRKENAQYASSQQGKASVLNKLQGLEDSYMKYNDLINEKDLAVANHILNVGRMESKWKKDKNNLISLDLSKNTDEVQAMIKDAMKNNELDFNQFRSILVGSDIIPTGHAPGTRMGDIATSIFSLNRTISDVRRKSGKYSKMYFKDRKAIIKAISRKSSGYEKLLGQVVERVKQTKEQTSAVINSAGEIDVDASTRKLSQYLIKNKERVLKLSDSNRGISIRDGKPSVSIGNMNGTSLPVVPSERIADTVANDPTYSTYYNTERDGGSIINTVNSRRKWLSAYDGIEAKDKAILSDADKFFSSKEGALVEDKLLELDILQKTGNYGKLVDDKDLLRDINNTIKSFHPESKYINPAIKKVGNIKIANELVGINVDTSRVENISSTLKSIFSKDLEARGAKLGRKAYKEEASKFATKVGGALSTTSIGLANTAGIKTIEDLATSIYNARDVLEPAELEGRLTPIDNDEELAKLGQAIDDKIYGAYTSKLGSSTTGEMRQHALKIKESVNATGAAGYVSHYSNFSSDSAISLVQSKTTGNMTTIDNLTKIAKSYKRFNPQEVREYSNRVYADWVDANKANIDKLGISEQSIHSIKAKSDYGKDTEYLVDELAARNQEGTEKVRIHTSPVGIIEKVDTDLSIGLTPEERIAESNGLVKTQRVSAEMSRNAWRDIVHLATSEDYNSTETQASALKALQWDNGITGTQILTEDKYVGMQFGQVPLEELKNFTSKNYFANGELKGSTPERIQLHNRVTKYIDAVDKGLISHGLAEGVQPYAALPDDITRSMDDALRQVQERVVKFASDKQPAMGAITRGLQPATNNVSLNIAEGVADSISKGGISKRAAAGIGGAMALAGFLISGMVQPGPSTNTTINSGSKGAMRTGNEPVSFDKIYNEDNAGTTIKILGRVRNGEQVNTISSLATDAVNKVMNANINVNTKDNTSKITKTWLEDEFLKILKGR